MTLKQQTITGISWSIIDNAYSQIITFIVGLILARLLEPREFGLIGMISIFIAVAAAFVDSGFSQALIRKNNCTQRDYSTVFYFNIIIAFLFYILIFFSATTISTFFNEKELTNIIKVIGVLLIFNALGIVHYTQLAKTIDIKTQTKIAVISNTISGIISISLAYHGFGVWSLVWRTLSNNFFRILLLWIWHKWRPQLLFSLQSFKELFTFGSKLLVAGLLNTFFDNLYYLVIGKFFSPQQLGYYTRAMGFTNLSATNISYVIQRVSYPALAQIQDDLLKLKTAFKKLIKITMYITFILMMIIAAVSKSLILTLVGFKWSNAILYMQLLCFSSMLYPLNALNGNVLNIRGRSNLFLKLEIIKKVLVIPVILIGIILGIIPMLLGMIIHSGICFYLNSLYVSRVINYNVMEQIKDLLPSFTIALFIGGATFTAGLIMYTSPLITLILQLMLATALVYIISELLNLDTYLELKIIMKSKIFFRKNNNT